MLVLKLRRDQSARIGPDVVVTCVRDEQGALVLGITAPAEWRIQRIREPDAVVYDAGDHDLEPVAHEKI